MSEKEELIDNLITKEELCLPVRSKLESAAELDGREINHLQQCRECLAFFQLIEDGVLKSAYDKNLKLSRRAPVNNFATCHRRYYYGRKTAVFFGNLSAFALSLFLFIGLLWLISFSLQNGGSADDLNIGAPERLTDSSSALYDSYAEKVNTNYQKLYEDIAAEEYSQVYIFDGAEIADEPSLNNNGGGRDEEFSYVLHQGVWEASGSLFDEWQSDMLAFNLTEEIDNFYAGSIGELYEADAPAY